MSAADMYKEFAQSHQGGPVSPEPTDREISSDQLNEAAKSHGGEVFDREANAPAAADASALDDTREEAADQPAEAHAPPSDAPKIPGSAEADKIRLGESHEFVDGLKHVSNSNTREKAMYMARKMQVSL